MSKSYLPYDPDQQLLLPAALQEWRPRITWPISYPTWWTSWICLKSRSATSRKGGEGHPTIPV